MNLTLFTDYALRTLIYVGAHPGQTIPASQVSVAYGISADHVAKAAKWLSQAGYLHTTRGKGGGLSLARPARAIRLGTLIRETEPHLNLLECFDAGTNNCALSPACRLKRALFEARKAFFDVLDGYTLADLLANAPELVQLLPVSALRPR